MWYHYYCLVMIMFLMEDTMEFLQISDVLSNFSSSAGDARSSPATGGTVGADPGVALPPVVVTAPGAGGVGTTPGDVLIPITFSGPEAVLDTIYDHAPITFTGAGTDFVSMDTPFTMAAL